MFGVTITYWFSNIVYIMYRVKERAQTSRDWVLKHSTELYYRSTKVKKYYIQVGSSIKIQILKQHFILAYFHNFAVYSFF